MSGKRVFRDVLPLHVFVRRRQITSLYRSLLKASRQLLDSSLKAEIRSQIRADFQRHKTVTDVIVIKSLIQEGNQSLKTLQGMISSVRKGSTATAGSWLDHSDEEDRRGRIGEGWPWQS
eukprot:gene5743-6327_t